MSASDRRRWNAKYQERREGGAPSAWVEKATAALGPVGTALDIACGTGANAMLLARRGWKVTAVDISSEAIALGRTEASGLSIDWVEADLDMYLPDRKFSLIVICRYLDRARLPLIVQEGLAIGGWVVAETFHETRGGHEAGHVKNPDFLLRPGEWTKLFPFVTPLSEDESGGMSRFLGRREG